jgi:hypothetical protein
MTTETALHEAAHLIAAKCVGIDPAASWVALTEDGGGEGQIQAPLDHPNHLGALLVSLVAGREGSRLAGASVASADATSAADAERADATAAELRPADPVGALREAQATAREVLTQHWAAVERLGAAIEAHGRLKHRFLADAVAWAFEPGPDATFRDRLERSSNERLWFEWCRDHFALSEASDARLVAVAADLAAVNPEAPKPKWMGGSGQLPASYHGSSGPDSPLSKLLDEIEVAELEADYQREKREGARARGESALTRYERAIAAETWSGDEPAIPIN